MKASMNPRPMYRDIIRDAIYKKIIDGEMKPGARVKELEWAELFGASQAPVREAIRDLESRGVVVSYPFKGAFVREMTVQELKDIHDVRAGLEGVAVKKTILKASDADIAGLKEILSNMKQCARYGETRAFREEDVAFHRRIVELADTTELMKFWERCNIELWTAFSIEFSQKELIEFANSHDAIYEVIRNRRLDQAYSVMDTHFLDIVNEVYKED